MDSIFWSPVAFGAAMAFASLKFFDAFLKASRRSTRICAFTWFLFVSSCNLLSMSRGAWVSEAVGVLVLLAMYKDKLRSLSLAMLAVVVLGGLIVSSDSLRSHLESFVASTEIGTGQIPRLNQRKAGVASVLENPLGYGVGSSGYIGARKLGPIKAVTDNWYLKTARELGIVDEVVVNAVDLAIPRGARGVRHGEPAGRLGRHQPPDEGRLPGPRGRAEDHQEPLHPHPPEATQGRDATADASAGLTRIQGRCPRARAGWHGLPGSRSRDREPGCPGSATRPGAGP